MTITGSDQERITIEQANDDHPNWGIQTTR